MPRLPRTSVLVPLRDLPELTELQERAEAASDVVVERSGYLGLTDDASKADEIGRRRFSNLVP
ncbi:hypothetical protein FXB39_02395 [Nocardioides sp. BGMRC 2183]|nr:hypothetical protein FXB39_02395 [Nocardioides sp. BGMRC 2183]